MTIDRFLAIFHPLHSRTWAIKTVRFVNRLCISIIIVSIMFNIPMFWRYRARKLQRRHGNVTIIYGYTIHQKVILSKEFDHAYRLCWSLLGNWIPLAVLTVSSFFIIHKVKEAKQNLVSNNRPESASGGLRRHGTKKESVTTNK